MAPISSFRTAPLIAGLGVLLTSLFVAAPAAAQKDAASKAREAAIEHVQKALAQLELAQTFVDGGETKRALGAIKKARKRLDKTIKVTQKTFLDSEAESLLADVRRTRRLLDRCEEAARGKDAEEAKKRFEEAIAAFEPLEARARELESN